MVGTGMAWASGLHLGWAGVGRPGHRYNSSFGSLVLALVYALH